MKKIREMLRKIFAPVRISTGEDQIPDFVKICQEIANDSTLN